MKSYTPIILALAATFSTLPSASAVPKSSQEPKYTTENFNATFDNIPTLPAEPLLSNVGAYDALYYGTYVATQLGLLGVSVAGVIPASGTQVATTGVFSQAGQTPYITSQYSGSKVVSFAMKEFALACALNIGSQSAASIPTACTVRLTGYAGSKKIAKQDVTYLPSNAVLAPMEIFTLDPLYFSVLTNLTLEIIVATGGIAATAMILDNVIYTVLNQTSS